MKLKPTEASLAYFLWSLHEEDRPMLLQAIRHVEPSRPALAAVCKALLSSGRVRYDGYRYEITEEGSRWVLENKRLVADAVLNEARARIPKSVFDLAPKPTQTTGVKS